jgi:hypothetical protein
VRACVRKIFGEAAREMERGRVKSGTYHDRAVDEARAGKGAHQYQAVDELQRASGLLRLV